MTCAEDIYRLVLEELASEGNEKASIALKMAERFATQPIDNSVPINSLKSSLYHLQKALQKNSESWSATTDDHLRQAQTYITDALVTIA